MPEICQSNIREDLEKLLLEADELDQVHNIVFKVKHRFFAAHRYLIALGSDKFLDIARSKEAVIELYDVQPEIFYQLLLYVYTRNCDLINCGKCPAELAELSENGVKVNEGKKIADTLLEEHNTRHKNEANSRGKAKDPVRMLQECAKKYGVVSLQKLLDDYYYIDGCVKCKAERHNRPKIIKFDRMCYPEFYDVKIKTKNGKEITAHKCVLVARLEYFSNLFSVRWAEVSFIVYCSVQSTSAQWKHFVCYVSFRV